MAETKSKQNTSLRTPQPKKRLGLSVPPALRMPHDDIIKVESMPSQTSQSSLTRHTEEDSIAPVRDFSRVANSINREAVPAGLFKGKSKQLYDCLYALTRGAIVPTRTVRISRPRLMKKAHIGARVTFETNIEHLISVGLVGVRQIAGEHKGNEYTVYVPEESMPSQTSQGSQTRHAQKLDRLVRLETSQTRHTLSVENTETYDTPKTSFKTKEKNTDDDEDGVPHALRESEREITGKTSQAQQWNELYELLATELRIAAARTTVSSVPAFLTEHLRRRLWKTDKKQMSEEENLTPTESKSPISNEQAKDCQECGGTGFYYPQGFEGGVARCRHEKLIEGK